MFRVFSQPYPLSSTLKEQLWVASIISGGVFFLLFVFQPFGLGSLSPLHLQWIVLGYAVVCFVAIVFNYLIIKILFPKFLAESTWKVYKEILWILWNTVWVGFMNSIYSSSLAIFPMTFSNLLGMVFITFSVAVLPVTLMIILKHNRLLKKNLRVANELNANLQQYHHHQELTNEKVPRPQITFKSEEKKGEIILDLDCFLYAQADDNYLEICYLKDEKLQKALLRNTLKNVEMDLVAFPSIFRCHRSYLVNLNNIKNVEGNSQGYRLSFEKTDFRVPVARNLSKIFKEKIGN
jgi:hypothetical protein